MKAPTPPIFIVEGLDVTVHRSVEDAQSWLEPWWIKQKEGVAYDAEGRLLHLKISKRHISMTLAEEEPKHPSGLESILRRFLKAIGEPIGDDLLCTLPCLVEFCQKFIM